MYIATVLAMYGRVHFRCHYIGDTIVGAILGIFTVFSLNGHVIEFVEYIFSFLEFL